MSVVTFTMGKANHSYAACRASTCVSCACRSLQVQLGPADGSPGVLQHCTGLTELALQQCIITGGATAAAVAIAVLQQLQSLTLAPERSTQRGESVLSELQLPSQLTHLSLAYTGQTAEEAAQLSQLSKLVNLGSLKLAGLLYKHVPGGLPSQLVKLSSLVLQFEGYKRDEVDRAQHLLQHLSSLTALQQLSFESYDCYFELDAADFLGIQQLSQLTALELHSGPQLDLTTSDWANTWSSLTALRSLSLRSCKIPLEALTSHPQLQALSLKAVSSGDGPLLESSLEDLLLTVSQLSLLTELRLSLTLGPYQHHAGDDSPGYDPPPPAAAFTAFIASSHLCSLQLDLFSHKIPQAWVCVLSGHQVPSYA